jgi:integrase
LEKRYKNSWMIIIERGKDPVTKKRDRIFKSVEGPKREAEKIMNEMLYQLQTGTYVETNNLTLAEYLMHWFKTYCETNLAPKTLHSYQSEIYRHIIPGIGSIPLEKLTPLHLQSYYSQQLISGRLDGKGGLSPRTVLYQHRILREALKHACRWQLVFRNVADAVQAPRLKKKEMFVLSREDVLEFLEDIKDHRDYGLILTAVYTGLRQGELLGLTWRHVDLVKKTLNVRQQLQYVAKQGYIFREPKTNKSKRQVPLTPQVVQVLKEVRKTQAEYKLICEEYHDHDLVFCLPNGKPLDSTNLTKRFKNLAKNHGYSELRFHDLRHTCATLLLAAGIEAKKVQEILGHESITTTLDVYGHVLPTMQREAMDRLSSFMKG